MQTPAPTGAQTPSDLSRIAQDLQIRKVQVEHVVQLLDEGNTIPFIARYRRDQTFGLGEELLRKIEARVQAARRLAERKQTISASIAGQGRLSEELAAAIQAADTPRRLDDLHLPFKPRKRSPEVKAVLDLGLEPLAQAIWTADPAVADLEGTLTGMVDAEKPGHASADEILTHASRLIAEYIAELPDLRGAARHILAESGRIVSAKVEGLPEGQGQEFRDYFQFAEAAKLIPPHRVLAVNRGERDKALKVTLEYDRPAVEAAAADLARFDGHPHQALLQSVVPQGLDALVASLEFELRRELTDRAQEHAVAIFARNLRSLLLQPALRGKRVLAVDPGTRNGCKLVALDEDGNYLEDATVYPHPPQNRKPDARRKMEELIRKHQLAVIAIGNGAACRETEQVVADLIADIDTRRAAGTLEPFFVAPPRPPQPRREPRPPRSAPQPTPAFSTEAAPELPPEPVDSVEPVAEVLPEAHELEARAPAVSELEPSPDAPPAEAPPTESDAPPAHGPAESYAPAEPHDAPGETPPEPPVETPPEVVPEVVAAAEPLPEMAAVVPDTAAEPLPEPVAEAVAVAPPVDLPPPVPLPPPPEGLAYVIVNEAGASDYSGGPYAREELPNLDGVTRATLSIGRRLQDPLRELVKVDPQHIGVGLYQHDVRAKHLKEVLEHVVESCVNHVGVDLNTATVPLLRHVAGLNAVLAREVIDYRAQHGPFRTREQLKDIPGLAVQNRHAQAAGFLKIAGGDEPLDATWVHPEQYEVARQILADFGLTTADLSDEAKLAEFRQKLESAPLEELATKVGMSPGATGDLLDELTRPGRDPREDLPPPIFKTGLLKLEDLKPGMELKGTVLNVVDFGAFVDIGLKDSGLVHISQMANRYIKSPYDVVAVGDVVTAWVLQVDPERRRVSLTMIAPGSERRMPERGERPPQRERGERPPMGERPPQGDRPPRRDAGPRDAGPPRRDGGGGPPRRDSGPRDGGPREGGRPPFRGGPRPDGPPPEPRSPLPPRKPKGLPKLSDAARTGKAPLQTFGELEAFFKSKDPASPPPPPPAPAEGEEKAGE